MAEALVETGLERHRSGDLAGARQAYEAALKHLPEASPARTDALHLLGVVADQEGRHEEAVRLIGEALKRNPAEASFHNNLGTALLALRRRDEAQAAYRRAVLLDPRYADAHYNLANLLREQNDLESAAASFKAAHQLAPQRLEPIVAMAELWFTLQRPRRALDWCRAGLALSPHHPLLLATRAAALALLGQFEEALAACDAALAARPSDAALLVRRGDVLEAAGRSEEALKVYERARHLQDEVEEGDASAEFRYAQLLLARGDFKTGWPSYGARWRRGRPERRGFALSGLLPRWDGQWREGLRLLVWGEQGIGDEILYASMLPDLIAQATKMTGCSILLLTAPRLVPLFRRSFPGIAVEGELEEFARFKPLADAQIPLADLGLWLRPDLNRMAPPRAYLKPDAERAAALRAKYLSLGRPFLVGLAWRSGNPQYGRYKSIPPAQWAPLAKTQAARNSVQFIDVQYGNTADDVESFSRKAGITMHHDSSLDLQGDLEGAAAQLSAMDLIISCSNSSVHLAGALGSPVWLCLPASAGRFWYWLQNRKDTVWYPKVSVFRQKPGPSEDWGQVVKEVADSLDVLVTA